MSRVAGGRLPFRIEEHFEAEPGMRLALIGELDLATAPLLEGRLDELRRGGYNVLLDLSRLDFIDSSGLRQLIVSLDHSRRDGWQLELGRELTDPVRRVIELVGVGPFFWPDASPREGVP